MRCVRVVIANRNPLISRSLADLLCAEGNFEVIASCATISECVGLVRAQSPDIAIIERLMSSKIPGQDILAAVAAACFFTRVVFLAASSEPDDISTITTCELPLKGSTLARCLVQIVIGHAPANSVPCQKGALRHQNNSARIDTPGQPLTYLTEREREIMHEISEGISNKEAARRLNISEGTIKLHLHHIYHKLSIKNRAELVAMVTTHSGAAWLVV
jgi:two-component system nitrate/nitrite response regulator NarL